MGTGHLGLLPNWISHKKSTKDTKTNKLRPIFWLHRSGKRSGPKSVAVCKRPARSKIPLDYAQERGPKCPEEFYLQFQSL